MTIMCVSGAMFDLPAKNRGGGHIPQPTQTPLSIKGLP